MTNINKSQLFLWIIWIIYFFYLILSDFPPGNSLLHITSDTVKEIIDLSLNFWFITPIFAPDSAPILNPILEGIFNFVVAWALLFWGFFIDSRGQKFPMSLFLIGTAFLTNVFYLPWLAIRQSINKIDDTPLSLTEEIAESRWLPSILMVIAIASIIWAGFARPEFGDLATRWASFQEILAEDRLAYSFVIDLIFFSLFQSWLVKDDMARRQWDNSVIIWITRLLPFMGLVIYFWFRPSLLVKKNKI